MKLNISLYLLILDNYFCFTNIYLMFDRKSCIWKEEKNIQMHCLILNRVNNFNYSFSSLEKKLFLTCVFYPISFISFNNKWNIQGTKFFKINKNYLHIYSTWYFHCLLNTKILTIQWHIKKKNVIYCFSFMIIINYCSCNYWKWADF